MAQAVFASGTANYVNQELWVELDTDTDADGVKDRVHVDVSRPRETDTDGLKVPVIYEDSPYYAGNANAPNWVVDHDLGMPPAGRIRAPDFNAGNTSPTISTIYESTWLPRGFAVVHSESPGSGNSTGCPNAGRADRDPRRHGRDRLAQQPAQGLHDALGHRRAAAGDLAQRQHRHDRDLLQRHDRAGGGVDRRRGPEGDRPDLDDLRLVRLLPRQRHGPLARRVPGRGPRRAHRVRLHAQRRGPAPATSAGP